jgi:hypothetical protein
VCRQQSAVCAPLVWRTARTIAHHELAHAARTRIVKRSAAFKLLAAYATAPTTDDEQLMRACDALLAHLQRTLDTPPPDDGDGECVLFVEDTNGRALIRIRVMIYKRPLRRVCASVRGQHAVDIRPGHRERHR